MKNEFEKISRQEQEKYSNIPLLDKDYFFIKKILNKHENTKNQENNPINKYNETIYFGYKNINRGYIYKIEDDYFIVFCDNKFYKCDRYDGIKNLIKYLDKLYVSEKINESNNYIQITEDDVFNKYDTYIELNQKEIDFLKKIPGFNYRLSKNETTIYFDYIDENNNPLHLYLYKTNDDYYIVYGGKQNDYKCDQLSGVKELLLNIKKINSSKQINELNLSTYRSASNKTNPYNRLSESPNKSRYIKFNTWYYTQLDNLVLNIFEKSNFIRNKTIIKDNFGVNNITNVENKDLEKVESILGEEYFNINHNYEEGCFITKTSIKIEHSLRKSYSRKIIIYIYPYKDDYYHVYLTNNYKKYFIKNYYYDQFYNVTNLLKKIKSIIL